MTRWAWQTGAFLFGCASLAFVVFENDERWLRAVWAGMFYLAARSFEFLHTKKAWEDQPDDR